MAEKRYYWMKLKEDFFDDDVISWIEEQPNGAKYCLFYLKLCLKAIKHNGLLVREVGDEKFPYDLKMLAKITNTDFDTAIVALDLFKKTGLIKCLDDGEIFLNRFSGMIGSETASAERMRRFRGAKSLPQ